MKETERRFITPDARIRGHASDHVAAAAVAPQQRAGDEKQRGGTLPVPQVGFSRFLREAQTRCRIRTARSMQKVLSANRVNIDSLHH